MAEKLAFQYIFAQLGAIERYERRSCRLFMCKALAASSLPVPLLAGDENRSGRRRDLTSLVTTECIAAELPMTPSKPNFFQLHLQRDIQALQSLRLRSFVGLGA